MSAVFGAVGLAATACLWASVVTGEERFELSNGAFVEPLDAFQECDLCPEMVVVPPETPFAQGEELSADQANFSRAATENLLLNKVSLRHLKNRRRPDAANTWGLRHMAGNVREITLLLDTRAHWFVFKRCLSVPHFGAGQLSKSCKRWCIFDGNGLSTSSGATSAKRNIYER